MIEEIKVEVPTYDLFAITEQPMYDLHPTEIKQELLISEVDIKDEYTELFVDNKQKQSRAEYMREYRAKIKEKKMQSPSKPPPLSSTERWRKFIANKRNNLTQATSSGLESINKAVNRFTGLVNNQLVIYQQEDSPRPSTSTDIVKSKPPPLSSTERANKSRNNKRKTASSIHLIIDKGQVSQNSHSTYYKYGLIINNSSSLNEQNNFLRESYIAPVINNSENSSIMIHEYRPRTNLIATTAFVHAMPSESSNAPANLNINNKSVRLGNVSDVELRLPPVLS